MRQILAFPGILFFLYILVQPLALIAQDSYQKLRVKMVLEQVQKRGVKDQMTLEAMRRVKRHLFIPESQRSRSYADHPVPIDYGQTISQPFIVGFMTEAIDITSTSIVLEIGTGSGYQAAVLAEIADSVFTIEIVPELGILARQQLKSLGYNNIQTKIGDGYFGWPQHAPYDAIIVTSAAEFIPPALIDQLKDPGKMIIPVGAQESPQKLVLITKRDGKIVKENLLPVRFVPFVRK